MDLQVSNLERAEVFNKLDRYIKEQNFHIASQDLNRPWGGFYVIDESEAQYFASTYFPKIPFESIKLSERLSPKFLIVAPNKRLSWQYHLRRAEIWKVLSGEVGVIKSETDIEGDINRLHEGDLIKLHQGERHRLVGLEGWAVLAEIWQHTDAAHPSDEEDIIRIQDDFGR